MKLKLQSIVFLLAGLMFIASCGKKSDVPVPADAGFVLHINGSSLNSKLSWDEIKQSEWYKILQQETSDSLAKQVLSDPATSGVDLKSDLYVFVRTLGKRGSYTGVVGNLTDEAALPISWKNQPKDRNPPKKATSLWSVPKNLWSPGKGNDSLSLVMLKWKTQLWAALPIMIHMAAVRNFLLTACWYSPTKHIK